MKTKNIFKALAMAMLMPAMLLTTACSNQDDVANTSNITDKGYALPVTVNVTRQGDEGTTRATYTYDEGTKKGTLAFSEGDKLFVEGQDNNTAGSFKGVLTWVSGGTFSGSINTEKKYTGTADELLTAAAFVTATLLPAGYESYAFLSIEDETDCSGWVSRDLSKAFAPTKKAAVEQFSYEFASSYSSGFALAPQTAILSFTISGLAANTEVAVLFKEAYATGATPVNVTTDASGVATFAVAVNSNDCIEYYTLTVDGYAIALPADKYVEAGHIYNISRSVAPAGPTAYTLAESTVGMIVGTDGKAYAVEDKDNLPTGVTAVAMVAYKSGSNGLAIALADESGTMDWSTAKSTCAGKAAIGGNSWKLPTQDEWKQMFSANGGNEGSYSGLNTKLATAGGTVLQENGDYWSSTPIDGAYAWDVFLKGGFAYWYDETYVGDVLSVRACLAF